MNAHYKNPTHNCPAFGANAIIPKVMREVNGELQPWGYLCPMCNQGREFTPEERADYLNELAEEADE